MSAAATVGLLINYRDSARSVACIESLLGQPIDRVLMWDNSADEGKSAAEVQAHFADDARISIFVSSHNLGFAAGANAVLSLCRERFPGIWILMINNDARLLAKGAEKLTDALLNNKKAKLAFPYVRSGDIVLGRAYYQYWTGLLSWRPRAGSFSYASGCCFLIATDRIDFPLFDEDFFMYGEDCELGWRLRQQPNALLHVQEVLVEHEGSASSGLGSLFYEERMVAAHWLLARKLAGNSRGRRFVLYCLRVAMLSARAAVRSCRFYSFVPWVALWRGWKIAFIKDTMRAKSASAFKPINQKPAH